RKRDTIWCESRADGIVRMGEGAPPGSAPAGCSDSLRPEDDGFGVFLLSQGVPQQWTAEDRKYMEEALRLARLGLGTASPNPMVGAVVVNEGRIVGTGYHERPGRPHAEAVALEAAGEKARGATLYVTLEPCSHYGRTPPCADLIIQRGVRRVVAA